MNRWSLLTKAGVLAPKGSVIDLKYCIYKVGNTSRYFCTVGYVLVNIYMYFDR